MKKIVFAAAIIALLNPASFADTIKLDGKEKYNIGLKTYFLEDKTNKLTFEDIQKSNNFKLSKKEIPNYGFSKSAIWCKFTVSIPDNQKEYFLEVSSAVLNEITFYETANSKILKNYALGDKIPYEKRIIQYKNCIFPLTKKAGIYTYYLRIVSTGTINVPLVIFTNKGLFYEIDKQKVSSGLYYGMLLIMIVFNLLLAIAIRQLPYLYYVCFIFFFMIGSMILDGIGHQHVWSKALIINDFLPFILCFTLFHLTQFTRSFLDTKIISPRSEKLLKLLSYLNLLIACLSLLQFINPSILPYNTIVKPAALMVVITFTCLTVTGVVYLKKKVRQGNFYLIAFLFVLIGSAITVMNRFGTLESNVFTLWSFKFGIIGQIVILTLGFADLINSLKNKLTILNLELEEKVEERTEELVASNQQLIQTRDALWGEMEIAKKIQTILLPEKPFISGFKISAYMNPANEVGGDYYDIINIENKNWLVIGDVSGHGLPAGLIMMMVQTSINTAIEQNPELEPSKLLSIINKTITKNIEKLNENKYMTLTVFAVYDEGKFTFSGLHQDIIIYRRKNKSVDSIQTQGMWVGMSENIQNMLQNDELTMEQGDMMLLYTDGITEAWKKGSVVGKRNPENDMFGVKKMTDILHQHGESSPNEVIESILQAMEGYDTDDDVTMVVVKKI